jgi:hypothetical protein
MWILVYKNCLQFIIQVELKTKISNSRFILLNGNKPLTDSILKLLKKKIYYCLQFVAYLVFPIDGSENGGENSNTSFLETGLRPHGRGGRNGSRQH